MSDRLGKNTVWIAFKPDHRNPEVQAPLLRRAGHSAREPGRGEFDLASVKPRGAEPLPSPGSGGSDREKPQGSPGRRRASLRGKRSAFRARHQARSHLAGAGNLPARTEAAHGQEAEKHCRLWERRSAAGRGSATTCKGSRKAPRAVGAKERCWQRLSDYVQRKKKSAAGCGSDGVLLAEAQRLRAKEAEKHCGLWERRSAAGRGSATTRTGSRKALRAVGATERCWQKLSEYAHRKKKRIAGCGSDSSTSDEGGPLSAPRPSLDPSRRKIFARCRAHERKVTGTRSWRLLSPGAVFPAILKAAAQAAAAQSKDGAMPEPLRFVAVLGYIENDPPQVGA